MDCRWQSRGGGGLIKGLVGILGKEFRPRVSICEEAETTCGGESFCIRAPGGGAGGDEAWDPSPEPLLDPTDTELTQLCVPMGAAPGVAPTLARPATGRLPRCTAGGPVEAQGVNFPMGEARLGDDGGLGGVAEPRCAGAVAERPALS